MSETLTQIEGVTEDKVDRLAALGMISVFDIEEIGAEVLEAELELTPEVALEAVELCATRAKVVAEEQAREKEEAAARRAEEEAAASSILSGDVHPSDNPEAAAAAILGGAIGTAPLTEEGEAEAEVSAEAEDRASDILGG